MPRPNNILQMASLFKVSVDELMSGVDSVTVSKREKSVAEKMGEVRAIVQNAIDEETELIRALDALPMGRTDWLSASTLNETEERLPYLQLAENVLSQDIAITSEEWQASQTVLGGYIAKMRRNVASLIFSPRDWSEESKKWSQLADALDITLLFLEKAMEAGVEHSPEEVLSQLIDYSNHSVQGSEKILNKMADSDVNIRDHMASILEQEKQQLHIYQLGPDTLKGGQLTETEKEEMCAALQAEIDELYDNLSSDKPDYDLHARGYKAESQRRIRAFETCIAKARGTADLDDES